MLKSITIHPVLWYIEMLISSMYNVEKELDYKYLKFGINKWKFGTKCVYFVPQNTK